MMLSATHALADLSCFGSAASEAAVRTLVWSLLGLSFSHSSLSCQLRRRLAVLHHAGNCHFTTPQWKEEVVWRAGGGLFGAPFGGWGYRCRGVSGRGEEAEGEGCFGSRGVLKHGCFDGRHNAREGRTQDEGEIGV